MAREARIIMERAKGKGLSGVSRINKTATRQIVFDILWSGVEGIPDEDAIDNLVARNIKREFGR